MENEEMRPEIDKGEEGNLAYIEAIKNLKENSVSKTDYESLKKERDNLVNALVNGQPAEKAADEEERPLIAGLKKRLFKPDHELSDIEYVSRALDLRDALIEQEGIDCFVGSSHSYSPTQDDYVKAAKVAEVFRECVDASNGNNTRFMAELKSRINDTVIIPR